MILLDVAQETFHNRDFHDYVRIYGSLVMSVITFVLGYVVANRISNKKERKELANIKEMFLKYEKSLIKSVESQIISYKKYKESLLDLRGMGVVAFDRVAFNFDFFDSLNKERLYMAFLDHKEDIDLYNFFVFHSYFKKVEQDMGEQNKELIGRYRELTDRWNIQINKLHDFISNLNVSDTLYTDLERKELMETYNNTDINDKSSLQEMMDLWVNPFIDILTRKYDETKGENLDLYKFLSDFHGIKQIHKEFKVLNSSTVENIDENIKHLNSSLKKIKRI